MGVSDVKDYITHHATSAADLAILAEMRRQSAPFKGTLSAPEGRAAYDEMIGATPGAEGVTHDQDTLGGVAGVWCRVAEPKAGAAILYLHGGGYGVGSAWAYRHFAGQFAARSGVDTFIADYPLAPEHPFPAALDHAKAVYGALAAKGYRKTVIVGDSAGGGLTLALLAAVSAGTAQAPAPVGAIVMSPWTDLTMAGRSHDSRAEDEFYLSRAVLEAFARNYLAGHNPLDPAISPQHGTLEGLPPIQIHVGTAEILLSDSEDYALKAHSAGTQVVGHVWEAMPHVFPSAFAILEGAERAMSLMSDFIAARLEV